MKRIYRSIIDIRKTPKTSVTPLSTISQEDLYSNFLLYVEAGLVIDDPAYQVLFTAIFNFFMVHTQIPTLEFLYEKATKEGQETVLAALLEISTQVPYIGEEYKAILQEEKRDQEKQDFQRLLADSWKIALDASKGGIPAALKYLDDKRPKIMPSLDCTPRQPTWDNMPPPVVPTLTLAGQRIGSQGNLTVWIAHPGAGKSSLSEAALASAIDPTCDSLGLTIKTDRPIAYIDTERSWDDHHASWQRCLKRACAPDMPEKISWFWLSAFEKYEDKRSFIYSYMADVKPGVLIIDGLADLLADVNDPKASSELILQLRSRATKYNINLICTIHNNPASKMETGKARGHLGSEAMRKAESVLIIKKDDSDIRTITTKFAHGKNRSGTDDISVAFRWDTEAVMMLSCDPELFSAPSDDEVLKKLSTIKTTGWSRKELEDYICDNSCQNSETRKSKVSRWLKAHPTTVSKSAKGTYDLVGMMSDLADIPMDIC